MADALLLLLSRMKCPAFFCQHGNKQGKAKVQKRQTDSGQGGALPLLSLLGRLSRCLSPQETRALRTREREDKVCNCTIYQEGCEDISRRVTQNAAGGRRTTFTRTCCREQERMSAVFICHKQWRPTRYQLFCSASTADTSDCSRTLWNRSRACTPFNWPPRARSASKPLHQPRQHLQQQQPL
jgi:hypothetical protein